MTNECIVWVKTWCSTRCTLKIGHLNADVVCIFVFFFFKSSCVQHGVDVDDDDWTPSPQSFHLPVCVAAGKPPSAGHITWVPTGQVCGPEIRPNPLGPESHPDTHITLWDLQLTQRGSQIIWIDHQEQRRHFLTLRLSPQREAPSMQMVRFLHNNKIKSCQASAHPQWGEATSL